MVATAQPRAGSCRNQKPPCAPRVSKVDPDTGDREYIFKQGELGSEFWIIITGVVCLGAPRPAELYHIPPAPVENAP